MIEMHIGSVNSVGAEGKMTMHLIIGNMWSIIQILTVGKLYVIILLTFYTGTVENILFYLFICRSRKKYANGVRNIVCIFIYNRMFNILVTMMMRVRLMKKMKTW